MKRALIYARGRGALTVLSGATRVDGKPRSPSSKHEGDEAFLRRLFGKRDFLSAAMAVQFITSRRSKEVQIESVTQLFLYRQRRTAWSKPVIQRFRTDIGRTSAC